MHLAAALIVCRCTQDPTAHQNSPIATSMMHAYCRRHNCLLHWPTQSSQASAKQAVSIRCSGSCWQNALQRPAPALTPRICLFMCRIFLFCWSVRYMKCSNCDTQTDRHNTDLSGACHTFHWAMRCSACVTTAMRSRSIVLHLNEQRRLTQRQGKAL